MAHRSTVSPTVKVCTPGFRLDPTQPTYARLVEYLKITSLRVLAATQGNVFINAYDIYQTPTCVYPPGFGCTQHCNFCDSSCQVCMDDPNLPDPCGPQSCGAETRIPHISCPDYAPGAFAQGEAFVWSHEWGHSRLGLSAGINTSDEYGAGPACGHTVMNGPANANFLCSDLNHCRDGTASNSAAVCANFPNSNWKTMGMSGVTPAGVIPAGSSGDAFIQMFWTPNQSAMAAVQVTQRN
jgi:hypothetical protein